MPEKILLVWKTWYLLEFACVLIFDCTPFLDEMTVSFTKLYPLLCVCGDVVKLILKMNTKAMHSDIHSPKFGTWEKWRFIVSNAKSAHLDCKQRKTVLLTDKQETKVFISPRH